MNIPILTGDRVPFTNLIKIKSQNIYQKKRR